MTVPFPMLGKDSAGQRDVNSHSVVKADADEFRRIGR
jgi:hypothetical protein